MKKPVIHFLDAATVDYGDIDMRPLKKWGGYQALSVTKLSQGLTSLKYATIVITNKVIVDRSMIQKLPELKLICVAATGYNNIDVVACRDHKVAVANAVGYSTQSVVEQTLMFLLSLSHRFIEHHLAVIEGRWSKSPMFHLPDFPYANLAGRTLGIVGYGKIGNQVAKKARALGLNVLIAKLPGRSYAAKPERQSLKSVFKNSDFVSLHCPLTEETASLVNAESLKWMKRSAFILNLARGPIVDEAALANALHKKQIAGYATDVMRDEPPSKKHILFAKSLAGKVFFTPHVAWASHESRQNVVNEIGANIEAFLSGKRRCRVV